VLTPERFNRSIDGPRKFAEILEVGLGPGLFANFSATMRQPSYFSS
jgi:hypothetical protein